MLSQFQFWKFFAGLSIFLFGMFLLENALKFLAARRFKKFLRTTTNSPIKGILGGTLITALLQSSSVVSLMTMAFVGAGIMQLKSAVGVIIGSNLGTTITGWIFAMVGFKLDIEGFALPFIALGGMAYMLYNKKNPKIKETGSLILGVGFLFLGLNYMKLSIGEFADQFDISLFQGWNAYLFFFVGLLITAIIQSSSASMVITLSALHAGIITLPAAAALVVGSDLGTTITSMLGAINGTPSRKRVALSHLIFNLVSDFVGLIILFPLLHLITNVIGLNDTLFTLVAFHSSFNLIGITIFFPFIKPFTKYLEKRFRSEDYTSVIHIDKVPTDVPDAAIEALKQEIVRLIDLVFYLNLSALRINVSLLNFEKMGDKKGTFRDGRFTENYDVVKQIEGDIVEYGLAVQKEKLEDDESDVLNRYSIGVRNVITSAKEIKDVIHNIREFENSSNDAKYGLYQFMKGRLNDFYLSLHNVFYSTIEASYYEKLVDLLNENQRNYKQFMEEIYRQIERKRIEDIDISTLLNVNREVHHSNRNLILAIKSVLLTKEDADSFNVVAEG